MVPESAKNKVLEYIKNALIPDEIKNILIISRESIATLPLADLLSANTPNSLLVREVRNFLSVLKAFKYSNFLRFQ